MTVRILIAVLLIGWTAAGQTIQLEGGKFKVSGWRPDPPRGGDWSAIFAVYAGTGDLPAMLGTYAVESGALVFQPRFPLAAGVKYRAVLRPSGKAPIETLFDGPKREVNATTRVERIYPSTDIFPANVLKFYVYFSAPMSRGEAWKHIHLLDEKGQAIPFSFVEIDQELWDPGNRRLTVLFDPGRIKRGLVPNQQMGAPIVEGRKYTLAIDKDYPDARGVPMIEGFRKPFRGAPSDRTPPDPKYWRVNQPAAGTRDSLVLTFPDSMDHALALRMIEAPVKGAATIEKLETEWRFTPAEPWKSGDYRLTVDRQLEDVAGNRVGRPFDVDLKEYKADPTAGPKVFVPFKVTSGR